jgi:pimeloyl-ACP methyl ester carboxylesterase
LGEKLIDMVKLVASDVEGEVVTGCGHFLPEERPEVIVRHVQKLRHKAAR